MGNNIIIFLHVMAAATGVGSLIYCVLLFLPAVEKIPSQKNLPEEQTGCYKALEILAPTVLASVLILVGTGIYYLLANYTRQVDLKPGYYDLFGIKMIFAAITVFLGVYQTFTLRPRISNLDLSPENRKHVPDVLRKMKTMSFYTLWAMVVAVFLGIWLARY